jgi:hypothetical protein
LRNNKGFNKSKGKKHIIQCKERRKKRGDGDGDGDGEEEKKSWRDGNMYK